MQDMKGFFKDILYKQTFMTIHIRLPMHLSTRASGCIRAVAILQYNFDGVY